MPVRHNIEYTEHAQTYFVVQHSGAKSFWPQFLQRHIPREEILPPWRIRDSLKTVDINARNRHGHARGGSKLCHMRGTTISRMSTRRRAIRDCTEPSNAEVVRLYCHSVRTLSCRASHAPIPGDRVPRNAGLPSRRRRCQPRTR